MHELVVPKSIPRIFDINLKWFEGGRGQGREWGWSVKSWSCAGELNYSRGKARESKPSRFDLHPLHIPCQPPPIYRNRLIFSCLRIFPGALSTAACRKERTLCPT